MGRMLENHSKLLLKESGIPVPNFRVASSPEEAAQIQSEWGCPVVLKALVPVGKRGKAGAVKFASSPEEARERATEILGMTVRFFPVEKVLVEEKLDIEQELFVSIAVDKMRKCPVMLVSTAGGMDIEEVAAKYKDKLKIIEVDPLAGLPEYKCREIWSELGLKGVPLRDVANCTSRLYEIFCRYDATILEVNPLVITKEGKVVATASLMAIDDAAMFRHPELKDYVQIGSERAWRPLTELEKKVVEVNEADPYRGTARYTEMEGGDIGFMCGGGGGSLLCFDALLSYGGKPANYTEFGGNPPERKVYGLVSAILSKPGVRGLLVDANITNNTQVDLVAQGIVRALQDRKIDPRTFPVVVRLIGVNNDTGREILEQAGIEYCGEEVSMSMAAKRMVEKMREFYQD